MAWTEERVEILKKLWAEGLSASQIANQLGEVSRNAVIGKVHRLGLARRAPSSRSQITLPRKARRMPGNSKSARQKFASREKNTQKVLDGQHPPISSKKAPVQLRVIEELVIPKAERKSIETLTACSCRWPIGDPESDDFHFCGRNRLENKPYCEFHAAIAYQPRPSRNTPAPAKKPLRLVASTAETTATGEAVHGKHQKHS